VKRFAVLFVCALTACSDDPDVDEGLAPEASSVLSGDAVVAVPLDEPHPVVIFLQMIADQSGTPLDQPMNVDVTVIPESDLSQGGDGVRTGPFAFGLVPPASYVVYGIVDVDENFNPLVPELAAPTADDLLGGYADVASGDLITIPVEPSQVIGEVTVIFSQALGPLRGPRRKTSRAATWGN
jgi:hypothetical protein